MNRWGRAIGYVLLGVVVAIIGVIAFLFLTRSDRGRDLVRRFAIEQVEKAINGKLSVDRIQTYGLLGGVALYDIELTDLEGNPFVQADSIKASFSLRSILSGKIVFGRTLLYAPTVTIEQLPGDTLWNFEHIFPPGPPSVKEERSLIEFNRARITDGTFIVRFPIEPEAGKELVPSDTARMIVRETPRGLLREMRFDEINARVPRVIWETPEEPGRLIEVASLAARGFIWADPFTLTNLRGAVTIRDSLIAFDLPAFAMTESRGSAIGELITGDELQYDFRISADQLAFQDFDWLYPPLPDEGGGSALIRIQTRPDGVLYLVEDARIHTPGTNIAGTFGMVMDDSLYFTQVDLRASPLDLRLLHQLVPDAPVLEGLLVGTVEVEGPLSALSTRGDFSLAGAYPANRRPALRWTGTFNLGESLGLSALSADLRHFDLALLKPFLPDAPASGTLSGQLRAHGRIGRELSLQTIIGYHSPDLILSEVEGGGKVRWVGNLPTVDLEMRAESLDFQGLAPLLPALGQLTGQAGLRLTARGSLDNLDLDTEVRTDAGRLKLTGNLDLAASEPVYRAEGSLSRLDLDRLLAGKVPGETGFAAHFDIAGAGVQPSTARAALALSLDSASIAGIAISSADLGLRVDQGLALVDSLTVSTSLGGLQARGSLGLEPGQSGALEVTVNADSLSELRTIFFPDAPLLIDPDSARGRIGGSARIEANIEGTIADLGLTGTARLRNPTVDAASAREIAIAFNAAGVGTDEQLAYRLAINADSLDIYGQRLDRAGAVLEFSHGGGWLEVEAQGERPFPASYHLVGGFQPLADGLEIDLRELRAQTGSEEWGLAEPTRIQIGSAGFEVNDLLFSRTTGAGRITASGRLPWADHEDEATRRLEGSEVADLRIEFQQLPIFSLREDNDESPLTVSDLTGTARVTGTAFEPRMSIGIELKGTRFGQLNFERIETRLEYVDRLLEASIEVIQGGQTVLAGEGRVPLDLRLTSVDERRLDIPLIFTARADGIPAAAVGSFIDGFRGIEGRVYGLLSLGGTSLAPEIGGQLTLKDGAAYSVAAGVRFHGISGTATVRSNQVVDLDLTARTTGGSATVSGTMDFADLVDPGFDLLILAKNFRAANRRDVELTASGEIQLKGSFTQPHIIGRIRVDKGTLYLDEVWRQYQIVTLDDPLVFDILDPSFAVEQLISDEIVSDFVKNMRLNAEIEIERDSWLRSRNLNVEASGRLLVEIDRSTEDIRVTGTLNAVRGTYELFVAENLPARRFMVRSGTVEFDGTPGVNANFDITAAYRVRTTDRQPLNVIARVTGDLENPRISLSNEGDEAIGESDLLSYLVFGRPTHALAGGEARQIDSYLTGLGAGILAPTYLGVWAMGIETIAGNLGIADYVSITPGEADAMGGDEGLRAFDPFSALGNAQFEVGNYLGDSWYMAVTRRFGQGVKPYDFGIRFEWRFAPTWTAEFFVEDRFARIGQSGFDQPLESRKVGGLFLFREWGF